eukprot:TRINITY_DN218_c0_g1_i1.p1 TRINITY_DN218_c0_g1~~TRINITY_DN218_c0_g1_i1.p1  ORF type:complete len:230 (+),score=107.42 TRINITY_DN218_c0_g1_i1:902-1591(+)
MTELMFDNFFNKLTSHEICAVLSVFIMEKPSKEPPNFGGNRHKNIKFAVPLIVHEAYDKIINKAREILLMKADCGLEDYGLFASEDEYISAFNPELILPMFQWVNGVDFVEINKLTTMFEGSLIRLIKRLRDVINQLADAAKAIGNEELAKKFTDCIEKIQRGIVFAASLYVDDMDDEEEEGNEEENEEEEHEDDAKSNDEDDEETQSEDDGHDDEASQAINDIFGDET